MTDDSLPPLKYLLDSSVHALRDFRVNNLNNAANIRKEIRKLMVEWAEYQALATFAEWLEQYGPQLLSLSTGETKPEVVELEKPKPLIEHQKVIADWRSERRRWRQKAG